MATNPTPHVTDDVRIPTRMTVSVGPLACQFGNQNKAMGLKSHRHTAELWLDYVVDPGHQHGYPSFKHTNDALRVEVQRLTTGLFLEATNEDVAERMFYALRGFADDSWHPYGGGYHLQTLHLDVYGVLDEIGHDEGATRYTITEAS